MARALSALLLLLALLVAPAAAHVRSGDRNRDRVPDRWERRHGVSTVERSAGRRDADRDGLSVWAEWRSGTDPRRSDSDGDGLPDGLEDRDRDGLANGFEVLARTDPGRADSDGDRRGDGLEDPDRDRLDNAGEARFGYEPRRRDTDRDGILDGREQAGVITAVAGASVTIALAAGGTLTASLDDATDVECPGDDGSDDDVGDDPGGDAPAEDASLEDDPSADEDSQTDDDDDPSYGDAPNDPAWSGCAAALRPGALVREAEVDGSVYVAIALLG